MNSARTSLFLHLLSACALMAYTVVACTVTPLPDEDAPAPAGTHLEDERENTPRTPGPEREIQ
ncbi:hypothetical protein OVA24_08770 [Luteolibacter sp. SL250]|uniref:hypothetical protein n=1 Tax=Luteolibacter sp. SL250 TaxID=2995170 RepID=UPI00226FC1DF|nr:hypothetical protein [Luteolibacter sp. SL250]WAC21478.1 hypothetical protein OVA24_08770 [Luteolibacter sp. SL250]